MAKTSAKKGTEVATSKAKAVAKNDELDGLGSLVAETMQLEADNRDVSGRQYSYLKLVGNTAQDPILKKGRAEYIEGAAERGWVIPSKLINLGEKVRITVLGAFKVYEDTIPGIKKDPKSKQEPMRRVVGYWMPGCAENVPVEGIFDRPYIAPDGVAHILRPVHWAFVYLHDHPEIEDAVITFRSTGNSVYKELQKLIQSSGVSSSELIIDMTCQEIPAKGWDKEYLYPDFEIVGRNYEIVEGNVKAVKGGLRTSEIARVIKWTHAMQKSYTDFQLVSKKSNIAALVKGFQGATIPEKTSASYKEDATEGKPAKF